MPKWVWLAALLMGLGVLTSCAYQGWTRYPCQEFENWQKPECNPPQCEALGVCTQDIYGDTIDAYATPSNTIKQ